MATANMFKAWLLILLTILSMIQPSQTDLSLSFTPFNYLLQWEKCCLQTSQKM